MINFSNLKNPDKGHAAKVAGVYIVKSPNPIEPVYVGSSGDLYKRMVKHRSMAKKGVHVNAGVQRLADQYGIENLIFQVVLALPNATTDALEDAERRFMSYYRALRGLLNIADAGKEGAIAACNKTMRERYSQAVIGVSIDTGESITFHSTEDAGRNGFSQGAVCQAARGILSAKAAHGGTHIYRGYKWSYATQPAQQQAST